MQSVQRWLFAASVCCLAHSVHGTVIFQESFESGHNYSVENGGANAAGTSFFTALPQSTLSLGYSVSNIDGSGYFGARDLDGIGSPTPHLIHFNMQDVIAYEHLSVAIALSARGGSNRFEGGDTLTIEYSPDGGVNFFELDRFTGATNGAPLSGGSGVLVPGFTDYSYAVPDGAILLAIRLTAVGFSASDESLAFDNLRIVGDRRVNSALAVSEPGSLFLAGLGALASRGLRRYRRGRRIGDTP